MEAVTHWLGLVVIRLPGEGVVAVLMDSFNKPFLTLCSSEASAALAAKLDIERRPAFIDKLKRSGPRWFHATDGDLENAFEEGVRENWKGGPKAELFWKYRPKKLREHLFIEELEAGRAYIRAFQQLLAPLAEGPASE